MSDTQTGQTPPWTTDETAPLPSRGHTTPLWFDAPGAPQAPPFPTSPLPRQGQPGPSNRRRIGEIVAVAALAAVLASGGTYAATQLGAQDTQSPSAASSSSSLGRGTGTTPVVQADPSAPNWTATAAAVAPSVVSITNQLSTGVAQGSGVVIDDKGHVLTNNHVVADSQKLTVTLSNGHTYDATIAGTDPSTDLAVVTINNPPSGLTPVAIGDSATLKVGDPVMAVGNPLGLAGTVTTGIVSAINRPVRTQGPSQQAPVDPFGNPFGNQSQQSTSEQVVTNAIQTSAAINPGNSGGSLVNGSGQLVGINSSIATLSSSSSSESGSIGIGFAIPVNEAKNIAAQLIDKGSAVHPYLGVSVTDGTGTEGASTITAAKVAKVVAGTGAAKAGLQAGDLIIAIDGATVESADSLIGSVRAHSVGDTITLKVLRNGQQISVKATLTAQSTTG